jgi:hypothetical protein
VQNAFTTGANAPLAVPAWDPYRLGTRHALSIDTSANVTRSFQNDPVCAFWANLH